MANLTLSVDERLLRRARIRALEQGTSVNAVVRRWLEEYAGDDNGGDPVDAFLTLAARSKAGSGSGGRSWTRDELHER